MAEQLQSFDGSRDDLVKVVCGAEHPICLVCYAPWCPTCRRLEQLLPAITAEFPLLTFMRVNVEANKELVKSLSVSVVPNVVIMRAKDGDIEVLRSVGGSKFDVLKQSLHDTYVELVKSQ